MKNISIRKAIGICYLGLGFVFASSAYSVQKLISEFSLSPFTLLFAVAFSCAFLCFLSFILWTFTYSLLAKYLGYLVCLSIISIYSSASSIDNSIHSFKNIQAMPIFLGLIAFLSLLSSSPIGFADKKREDKNIDTLDSDMLYDERQRTIKAPYFWSINRIYSVTLAILSFPFLVMAMYSSNFSKGFSYWEASTLFAINVFAVLFWLKPKWAKIIFIILSSIALIGGVILHVHFWIISYGNRRNDNYFWNLCINFRFNFNPS